MVPNDWPFRHAQSSTPTTRIAGCQPDPLAGADSTAYPADSTIADQNDRPARDPPADGLHSNFSREPFIERNENGVVFFRAKGKDATALKGVKVKNATWIGGYLARLSDRQFADAFRAGGFSDEENAVYVSAMRQNIEELEKLGK
jgi:hypothetical protein